MFGLVRMALTGLMGMLLLYAVLSWVQTRSPVAGVLSRALLRPRRILPLMEIGSVLAALLLLQVAADRAGAARPETALLQA